MTLLKSQRNTGLPFAGHFFKKKFSLVKASVGKLLGVDAQPESGEPCLPPFSLSKEAWLEAGHRSIGIKTHGLGSIPGPGRSHMLWSN